MYSKSAFAGDKFAPASAASATFIPFSLVLEGLFVPYQEGTRLFMFGLILALSMIRYWVLKRIDINVVVQKLYGTNRNSLWMRGVGYFTFNIVGGCLLYFLLYTYVGDWRLSYFH